MDHDSRDGDLSSTRKLLTNAWTKRVDTAEIEIKRFKLKRPLTNDCKVVFFEIADDTSLHVNVTHRYPTKGIIGWAGPATMPEGFVHNRKFVHPAPAQMIRYIRDMVFADRI